MSFIERVRKNVFLRKIYLLPGVSSAYHFILALFGAIIFGFPSRKLVVIGITGTKGKTTVAELLAFVLENAGFKTALLSSVHSRIIGKEIQNKTGNSMPGRFFIQRFLRDASRAGATYAIIEVTSQGVTQKRHRFIEWNIGLITNIAPEHIESHGSFEKYRDAKLAFLRYAANRGAAVFVNADDEPSNYFKDKLSDVDLILYSASTIEAWPENIFSALPGDFNKQNVAATLAVARKLEIADTITIEALEKFGGVPGRMEIVASKPFKVIVDYAHTPDSLRAAYKAARASMPKESKLIAVFGSCGGGRDKWKRPAMGEVAARLVDRIILTNEDPYDEDPAKILADIKAGVDRAGFPSDNFHEELDRAKAMRLAFSKAAPGDTVIITGKGSETSIHIKDGNLIDWSDKREAQKILNERNI